MRYWAVDDRNLNHDGQLVIESHLRVSIAQGDEIIIFNRSYGDIEFHSHTSVKDAQLKEMKQEYQIFVATLSQLKPIENPPLLSELAYSLLKIYRYDKAERHFRRQYVSLYPEDFGTIVTGSVYWARTAFGLYANELRSEQFIRFMQDVAQSTPEVLLQTSDFSLVWKALRNFIEEEYIATANLLRLIHAQVDQLQSKENLGLDYSKLGISTDDDNISDLLHKQEQLLSKFMELTRNNEIDVLQELSQKIKEESYSESQFQEIFRGTTWPLHTIGE